VLSPVRTCFRDMASGTEKVSEAPKEGTKYRVSPSGNMRATHCLQAPRLLSRGSRKGSMLKVSVPRTALAGTTPGVETCEGSKTGSPSSKWVWWSRSSSRASRLRPGAIGHE